MSESRVQAPGGEATDNERENFTVQVVRVRLAFEKSETGVLFGSVCVIVHRKVEW
jgi:hypothetical protein